MGLRGRMSLVCYYGEAEGEGLSDWDTSVLRIDNRVVVGWLDCDQGLLRLVVVFRAREAGA